MDHSCCSCRFSIHKDTKCGDEISCDKGKTVTREMLIDSPCEEYLR